VAEPPEIGSKELEQLFLKGEIIMAALLILIKSLNLFDFKFNLNPYVLMLASAYLLVFSNK
jgi:hypothetical protein